MKLPFTLIAALVLSLNFAAQVTAADDMSKSGMMDNMKSSDTAMLMTAGEVKKIDKEAGKITLKHGPLANLDMPAMTMVFRVKDPSMLNPVKVGDKVSFIAEKLNGAITVTKLEPAK